MIDLEVNLISPAKKHKLKSLIKFLFIKEYLELIMLAACLVAIVFLGTYTLLNQMVNDLSNSSLLVNRDFSSINQEIRGINSLLNSISSSGAQFVPLTPRLVDITNILPADIRLTNLSIDRAQGSLSISGVSATRESLLSFQKSLLTLSWISTVNIPKSQLFQKENVAFEVIAILKDTPIKEKKTSGNPTANVNR